VKGLLKVGVPKSWEASKNDRKYVREAGVRQFISTYNRVKDLQGDALLWGDEIEYGIFKVDHEQKKVRLSLRAKEVRLPVAIASVTKWCSTKATAVSYAKGRLTVDDYMFRSWTL
jgi:hypothetical protein